MAHYSREILGDLNARINGLDYDFIIGESLDGMHDFLPNNYNVDNCHLRRNTQIPQITNEYGKNIIDICIGSQL